MTCDVNHSDYKFNVKDETIYFSLGAIKGVGEGAVENIIDARNKIPNHKFENLDEFFESVDTRKVNRKALECLIKAGAFDNYGAHRAQLINGYEKFLERAESTRKDKEVGQVSLFAMADAEETQKHKVILANSEPWGRGARLAYEKEVLGFYLSDHPLSGYTGLYKMWTTCTIDQLKTQDHKKRVVLAGLITSVRDLITKKGTRMAFAQLEDLTGQVELVVFPDVFVKAEAPLKSDLPVLLGGVLERDGEACKILVDRVGILEEVLRKSKHMTLKIDASMQDRLGLLSDVLKKFPGSTGVELEIELPDLQKTVTMEVSEPLGIDPTQAFFENLHGLFGRTDFVQIRA